MVKIENVRGGHSTGWETLPGDMDFWKGAALLWAESILTEDTPTRAVVTYESGDFTLIIPA